MPPSALGPEEFGAFLRREGVHQAELEPWRAAVLEAGQTALEGVRGRLLVAETGKRIKALTRLQRVEFQNNQIQDLSPLNDKPLLKEISAQSNALSTLDNLIVGAAPAPPAMPCYGLFVNGNPLPNAEAQTERFWKLHWTVTWDKGPDFHGCNAECLEP